MSRVEEEILVWIPEPQPEPEPEDWKPLVLRALGALGPGHRQQWLSWKLRRHIGTISRWFTGKTEPSHADIQAMYAAIREEAELHLQGDCSKARYISQLRLGDSIRPKHSPQYADGLAA